jgi:Uma2 family endonuclease
MSSTRIKSPRTPPLQSGDRLTAEEFERRYHAMPNVTKAELIEGEVYMPSPVNHEFHAHPHGIVMGWLVNYNASTPGVEFGDNSTDRLDACNVLQPDALLLIRPECGGRVTIDTGGYLNGAPELIVEVSASRVSIDLGKRLDVYQRNQVCEYVVWRVYDEELDWFVLRGGQYAQLTPDPTDGLLKSETFAGLWLDAAALVRRDLVSVFSALSRGVASSEHAAFVARLAARRQMS